MIKNIQDYFFWNRFQIRFDMAISELSHANQHPVGDEGGDLERIVNDFMIEIKKMEPGIFQHCIDNPRYISEFIRDRLNEFEKNYLSQISEQENEAN